MIADLVIRLASALSRLPDLLGFAFLRLELGKSLLVELSCALNPLLTAMALGVWQHLTAFVCPTP